MIRLTHVRRHRTRRGLRRAHRRRVRTHVTIPKLERHVLTHLVSAAYPVEMGGGLDFDKTGRLERIHVQRGTAASIDLPPDFEVQYHTHPKAAAATSPSASPEDVLSLLQDRAQQAELIVRPRITEVLVKSPSIGALSKLPATRIFSKLDRAYLRSQRASPPRAARRWYDELRSLGLHVTTHPNTGPLRIPHVRPVEPRRARGVPWA